MAEVRPFKGVFYNQDKVELGDVVTLPYDVITDEKMREYARLSEKSFIHLILPDGAGDEKYRNSARLLGRWLEEKTLLEDEEECMYAYEEEYEIGGEKKVQRGIVCLVKVEPFEKQVILPHEEIYGGPLEDRYKLLKATETDLEMIMGIYSDPAKVTSRILKDLGEPVIDLKHADNIRHRIWRIRDGDAINEFMNYMNCEKIIIADGHHRYTTALKYHVTDNGHGKPYMLIWLLNMDGDLNVMPTHRLISHVERPLENIEDDLKRYFEMEKPGSREELMQRLRETEPQHTFGFYMKDRFMFLKLKDNDETRKFLDMNGKRHWKDLDVNILHTIVINKVLGLPEDTKHIQFIKDADKLFEQVDEGKYRIGLLLNATKLEQVKKIAGSGHRMPQKSTYFYPKPLSGLILRRH